MEEVLEVIDGLPPGRRPPSLRAHADRFRARLAAEDGGAQKAERSFAAAASTFSEFGMVFWLAVALTEHGEWLASEGRAAEAEPLLAEASATFVRLEAGPWLERVEAADASLAQTVQPDVPLAARPERQDVRV